MHVYAALLWLVAAQSVSHEVAPHAMAMFMGSMGCTHGHMAEADHPKGVGSPSKINTQASH